MCPMAFGSAWNQGLLQQEPPVIFDGIIDQASIVCRRDLAVWVS